MNAIKNNEIKDEIQNATECLNRTVPYILKNVFDQTYRTEVRT